MSIIAGTYVRIDDSNLVWVVGRVLDGGLEIKAGDVELSIPTQAVRDEVIMVSTDAPKWQPRLQSILLDPKEMAGILAKRNCFIPSR